MTEVLSGCAVRAAVQQTVEPTMTPELQVALVNLQGAVEFIDKIRADTKTDAYATGAWRDAHEWLEEAARKVVEVSGAQA